jgi:hypothetical protein
MDHPPPSKTPSFSNFKADGWSYGRLAQELPNPDSSKKCKAGNLEHPPKFQFCAEDADDPPQDLLNYS